MLKLSISKTNYQSVNIRKQRFKRDDQPKKKKKDFDKAEKSSVRLFKGKKRKNNATNQGCNSTDRTEITKLIIHKRKFKDFFFFASKFETYSTKNKVLDVHDV